MSDELIPAHEVADESAAEVAPERTVAKEKSLGHYLGVMFSIVLLIFVAFMGAILIVIPKVGGAIPLTVLTQSMEPGLPPGTLIVVGPVEADDIEVGDVITYQIRSGEPDVITHRIIGFSTDAEGERTFILQGDNNDTADDPVIADQIQARLWYAVPYLGWVNALVNGENRSWIIAVIAGLFFAYALYMIVSAVLDRRKNGGRSGRRAAGRAPTPR